MPVRYEQGDEPRGSTTTDPAAARRSRSRWLMIVLPVVLLLIALVLALVVNEDDQPDTAATEPTDTAAEDDAGVPGSELPRGDASFGGGGSSQLYGIPIGYQQTRTGGIQAALNYTAGSVGLGIWNNATRGEINNYLFTDDARAESAITDDLATTAAADVGLSPSGQVLNEDGTPNEQLRLYADYLGKYGAYRVVDIEPNEDSPDSVTVETWGPNIFGPGADDDLSRVEVTWSSDISTVSWVDGDWRISEVRSSETKPPAPRNPRLVNVSFEERARLLGEGWLMPSNATEEVDPLTGVGVQ